MAATVFVVVTFATLDDVRAGKARQVASAVAVGRNALLTRCAAVADSDMITLGAADDMLGLARVVERDPSGDRCVLALDAATELPAFARVRDFGDLAVGEPVYAVAAQGPLDPSVGAGAITALLPDERIAFDAPLAPGSTGGGLFDGQGRLVGLTAFVALGRRDNVAIAARLGDTTN
jgi:S1-C subfamily serine protease